MSVMNEDTCIISYSLSAHNAHLTLKYECIIYFLIPLSCCKEWLNTISSVDIVACLMFKQK